MTPRKAHDDDVLLTPEQLADRWHMTVGGLSNWRGQRRGPKYMKIGGKIHYPLTQVLIFEARCMIETRDGR